MFDRRHFLGIATAGIAGVVAGCTTRVKRPAYADITFTHQDPISLDVRRIDVIDQYSAPGTLPNVEHEFPVSLEATAERWASDRLRANGSAGSARVRILDASVVEQRLETKEGISGLVTTDQSEKYSARLLVEVVAENPARGLNGSASAEIRRSRTVPEGLTLNEREKIWYEMAEKIARDMDERLENAILTHMSGFVLRQ